MNHFLESAKKRLQAEPLPEREMLFMGVPIDEFEKEDLIRIIHWDQMQYNQLQDNADKGRQMWKMFAEARR